MISFWISAVPPKAYVILKANPWSRAKTAVRFLPSRAQRRLSHLGYLTM
jgi:hypothetical protein